MRGRAGFNQGLLFWAPEPEGWECQLPEEHPQLGMQAAGTFCTPGISNDEES